MYGRAGASPQHDGAAPKPEEPQSEVDAVLDLQQTYGNQAVVQLLAAGGHGSPPPVLPNGGGMGNRAIASLLSAQRSHAGLPRVQRMPAGSNAAERVQHLRAAIRFENLQYRFVINEAEAADALDNMTPDDGALVRVLYQQITGYNLGWVLSAAETPLDDVPAPNTLSYAGRTKLLNLLGGTVTPPVQAPAAPAAPEAAPAAASGGAGAAVETGPAAGAAPAGGAGAAAKPAARPAPPDPDKIRKRRQRALAASLRLAIEKKDADKAISLIPDTMEERREIDALYQSMYGKTAYMELFTKLPGRDGARAGALWYDEKDEADRYAIEAGVEARDKAEKEAQALESSALGGMLGDAAKAKRQEGDKKLESAVRKVATSGDRSTVEGKKKSRDRLDGIVKAVERGEGRAMSRNNVGMYVGISDDPVLKAIAQGHEADEIGARLARADSIKDVSSAEIEAALREVREAAEDQAGRELASLKDGETVDVDAKTKEIVDGYFVRFREAFNHAQKRRTFLEMMGGHGGSDEKVAKSIGVDVDALREVGGGKAAIDRNLALLGGKGQLDEVSELVFALRSKPKDIDRVRDLLADKTFTQVDALDNEYQARTKHTLEQDLAGTELEQKAAKMFNETNEDLQEKKALLVGGQWDRELAAQHAPGEDDPVGREAYFLKSEGDFWFRKAGQLQRRVVENRGLFARARDWSGNVEKDILDTAESDRWAAMTALGKALAGPAEEGGSGPDLAGARKAVEELRAIGRRMTHAASIYKEATKKAYDEFVDNVVEIASIAAGLGVTGIWMTALRTTAATVGTKFVLKGGDYSADEFLADLEGGMASVVGDFAKLGMNKLVTPYVASKMMQYATRIGMSKELYGKVAAKVGPLALRQAEHTLSTAVSNELQGKSWTEGQGVGARLKGEAIGQITHPINEHIENVRDRGRAGYGEEADGVPRAIDDEGGTSAASRSGGGGGETEPATGASATPDAASPRVVVEDAEPSAPTPMALPEPAAGGQTRRKKGVPPPVPEAAKRPRKAKAPVEEIDAGTGPRQDDEAPGKPVKDSDAPVKEPGAPVHGPAEARPPVDWDHQLVIQLGEATNRGEAHALMVKMFGQSPTREVGLYRNTKTGEYIVIQGEERTVGLVPKPGATAQRWKEILEAHSKVGRWELEAHTHPNGRPYPSGAPGDFGQVVREALNKRKERQSEIVFPTSNGELRKTTFGYDPEHDAPFWIKPDGYDEPLRFASLEQYNEFIGNPAAVEPWVPRGKVDWDRLPEITKAANASRATGPREPEDASDPSRPSKKSLDDEPTPAATRDDGGTTTAPQGSPDAGGGVDMSALPPQTIPALTAFAKHYHLVIDIRPPGSRTRSRLAEGAIAKPEAIKAKTINEADLVLGARGDALGLVGYFEPKLPDRPKSMGDADWKTVTDRYEQRAKEFGDLEPSMNKLLADGTIQIENGVVKAIDPTTAGHGPARYRAVAGDIDIYQIRRADGRPLSGADAERYAMILRSWGIAVEHGAHLRWLPKGEAELKIFKDIIAKHGPGGEPLIRIDAGDAPKLVNNTTPITPRPGRGSRIDASGDGVGGMHRDDRRKGRQERPAERPVDEPRPVVDKNAKTNVGSDAPADHDEAATVDLRAEPNRPASRATGAEYPERPRSRYKFLHPVGEGINGGWVVRDLETRKLHLFKRSDKATNVPRAEERGIEKEDYAARSSATELAANALGLRTPHVELVSIAGNKGSLTEWWPTKSLNRLMKEDRETFDRVVHSAEFKQAQASIDALDYLVNNLDRNQNLGNYLIQLDPRGNFVSLAPIDHDLTFTSTGMRAKLPDYTKDLPHEYPPKLAIKLMELERNLPQFLDSIRPLVGEEALPGVELRLKELIKDMEAKQDRHDRVKARGVGA